MKTYLLGGAALIALALLSLCIGAASLWGGDLAGGWLIAVSRFPRTAAALLSGMGLALAGVVVQQAVQNRFVEPGLSGTPESAMLGLLAVTLALPGSPLWVKMALAALSALLGTAVFLKLAQRVPRSDPMLLPLVGMIYSGILGASAIWIAWSVDLVQYLGTWQMGEFSGVVRGRYELLWLIAGLAALLYALADRITILGLGEAAAKGLGLDYRRTILLGLGVVSAISAVQIVTVGALPFVGLVVPNIVSRLAGDNLRRNLPLVAMAGAGAVLAADILGRIIRFPYEIPAATIFAVVGAGLFLWLLARPVRSAQGGQHG